MAELRLQREAQLHQMWSTRFLFLAFVAVPQQSDALIFGRDDRVAVPSGSLGVYSPIGAIYGGALSGHATAFLIGPCHVLTVRHAFGTRTTIVGARTNFAAGVEGAPSGWAITSAQVVEAGEPPASTGDFSNDWAILKLQECLGRRYGIATLSSFEPREEFSAQIAGFPNDKSLAAGLILDPTCMIRSVEDGIALHDCATQPGNSGSPIFQITQEGDAPRLAVVAMNTSGHFYGVPGANLKLPVTEYMDSYASQGLPVANIRALAKYRPH